MFYKKHLLSSLSKGIKAILIRIELSNRSQSSQIMKFTLLTLLLAAPVLGDLLHESPFVGDSILVARTTSKGATCVCTLRIHQDPRLH